MCNVSAHARGVCERARLSYRQSNCSFSIVPLPSFVHVAELLCETSVAPERLPPLWMDVRWRARVDEGTQTKRNIFPVLLLVLTVKLLQITIIVPELRHAKCSASRFPFIHPQQTQSLSGPALRSRSRTPGTSPPTEHTLFE